MLGKIFRLLVVIWLMVSLTGCASLLTRLGSVQSDVVDGEKTISDFSKYGYGYKAHANKIYLNRVPMCGETVEKLKVSQKLRRGMGFAMFELVFFGFGFIDMMRAQAIAEESKKVYPLATIETGKYVECGDKVFAADEAVIIENKQRKFIRKAKTDRNGILDLNKVLYDVDSVLNVKIRLESDESVEFSYLYVSK